MFVEDNINIVSICISCIAYKCIVISFKTFYSYYLYNVLFVTYYIFYYLCNDKIPILAYTIITSFDMKFNSKQANQQYSSFNLKDFFGMNNPKKNIASSSSCSHFLCPWSCFLLVCKSFLRPRSGIKDEAYLLW